MDTATRPPTPPAPSCGSLATSSTQRHRDTELAPWPQVGRTHLFDRLTPRPPRLRVRNNPPDWSAPLPHGGTVNGVNGMNGPFPDWLPMGGCRMPIGGEGRGRRRENPEAAGTQRPRLPLRGRLDRGRNTAVWLCVLCALHVWFNRQSGQHPAAWKSQHKEHKAHRASAPASRTLRVIPSLSRGGVSGDVDFGFFANVAGGPPTPRQSKSQNENCWSRVWQSNPCV